MSQPIGEEPALDWLINRREDANYKQGRFVDPDVPAHFSIVAQRGFRLAVDTYLREPSSPFVFDPDHSMIAFPSATLLRASTELRSRNLRLDADAVKFLSNLGRDRAGRISCLGQLL